MKTAGCVTCVHFLIAIPIGSIGATALSAQEYVRESEPKLFSYDELVQLSLDQELSPIYQKALAHYDHSLHQQ